MTFGVDRATNATARSGLPCLHLMGAMCVRFNLGKVIAAESEE